MTDLFGHDQPQWHAIKAGAFVCTAPEDAPCRNHPTCECENWSSSEPGESDEGDHNCLSTRKPGQPCWIGVWIDEVGLGDSYEGQLTLEKWTGDDDGVMWPDGPVVTDWDDSVMWGYRGAPA